MARRISCGVVVGDAERILLGHATRSPRWDIPKGLAEPGESYRAAAARELGEETGLVVRPEALIDLGNHGYLPGKDLALFGWSPWPLPDPAALRCAAMFTLPSGRALPEFDRFGLFGWPEALTLVGKNMARALEALRAGAVAPWGRRRGMPS